MHFSLNIEYLGSGHIYPALNLEEVKEILYGMDISKVSKMELKQIGWQT